MQPAKTAPAARKRLSSRKPSSAEAFATTNINSPMSLAFDADGNPDAEVPIEVTVDGFTLPVEGHLKTAFALMEGFPEKVYGRKGVTRRLRQSQGDFPLAHRLNPDDITRTDLPGIDGLLHDRDRGLTAFNVLNMLKPRGAGVGVTVTGFAPAVGRIGGWPPRWVTACSCGRCGAGSAGRSGSSPRP